MALYIRRDEFVKTVLGPAVPGAQVYVCTQPANTISLPPSPLATIYGDSDGITQLQQPLITDGFGHTYFYAAPNVYTIVVADNGTLQQVYPDQSLGSGISLQTNGTPNTNQSIENLVAGENITLTPDGFGATIIDSAAATLVLQTNGVFNPDQALLNLQDSGTITISDNGAGTITFEANTAGILAGVLDTLVSSYTWQAFPYNKNANQNGGSLVGALDNGGGGGGPVTATQFLPSSYNILVSFGVNNGHGFQEEEFVGQGNITIGIFSTWESVLAFQSDDTSRHWIGIGTGTFGSAISASAWWSFNDFVGHGGFNAPDFVGFRFSPAPGANDVHWQAYVGGVALNSSTLVDTGISPTFDGHPHVLKVVSDGTNFTFYVDGVLGATIVIPALYKTSFSGSPGATTNGSFLSAVVSDTNFAGGGTVDWNLVAVGYTLVS